MLYIRTCALVLTCALSCSIAAGQEPPEATTLLAKMEADTGTKEARAAVKSVVAKGHVSAAMMPGKGELTERFVGHDRGKLSVAYKGIGDMTMGITPKHSWSTDPAMGIAVMSGAEAGSARRLFGIARRTPWNEMYKSARTVGDRKVKKRACWELEMVASDGTKEKWFLDQETHRLARIDVALPDMMGGKMTARFYYTEWKRFEGVLFPVKRTQSVSLMKVNYEWNEVSINPEIKPSEIEPDEKVRAAIAKKAQGNDGAPKASEPGKCGTIEREEMHVATIRVKIKPADVSRTLAILLPEVGQHLKKHGGAIAGPPFSRYHSISDTEIDIEAGIPVREPVKEAGRVKARTLPAGKTATVWHQGEYHRLPETHAILQKWIEQKKLTPNGALWEMYWTDPGIEPDPKKWRTQLFRPVK